MMAPEGANCEKVTSSSSGNWRQYLNLSSENEGDSAPEPSTAPAPADRPPEQSTSSTWSGSWIGRWLNQEVSQNEGGTKLLVNQPEPGSWSKNKRGLPK